MINLTTPELQEAIERNPRGERLLKAQELAEYLQIHEVTLRKLAAAGKIPSIKIGRIKRYRLSDVLAYANEGTGDEQ